MSCRNDNERFSEGKVLFAPRKRCPQMAVEARWCGGVPSASAERIDQSNLAARLHWLFAALLDE